MTAANQIDYILLSPALFAKATGGGICRMGAWGGSQRHPLAALRHPHQSDRRRTWAETVIRAEVPAHIQPRICWIGKDDMAELERCYRDWIYLRAGRETAARTGKLTALRDVLVRARSVYPTQQLNECDAPENVRKFILGQTALGTLSDTTPGE